MDVLIFGPMNFYLLIPFIAYTINSTVALYVFFMDPSRKVNRVFCAGLFFVAAWNLSEGIMRSRVDFSDALLWSRIMLTIVFFIPSFILYFSLVFANHPFSKNIPISIFIFSLPFLFSAFLLPYIHKTVTMTPLGYDYVPGPLFPLFSILYLLICLITLGIFYRKYFLASSKSEKGIFIIILLGFTLPVILGLFTNLFSRMLGIFLPKLGSLFSVFVSLSFFYAIKKHRFLILPISEKKEQGLPLHMLQRGTSYIMEEEMPERSYRIFFDLVSHGIHGIIITRTHPSRVKTIVGLQKTPMFWLTSIKGEQNLEPQDLSKILYIVSSFLRESSDSVVLLEGIEYLTYSNTFDAVLRFIYALDDCITLNDSRLILPVNPKTFSVKEMGLLKKEMTIL
jgi:hypothetical protein